MRVPALHAPTASRIETSRQHHLAASVGRLLHRYRDWRTRRTVLAELRGLDAHTLADLRLYPGDFEAIADGTYIRAGGAHDIALKPAADASPSSRRHIWPYY